MSMYAPPRQPASAAPGSVTAGYAGFWRRLLAVILDGIVVSIPANIFAAILGSGLIVTDGGIHFRFGSGLQAIFFIVYEALLIAYWNGQTIGKKAMGIRVVSKGGAPVSVGMAFVRSIMKIVSGMALLLGYLWMLWDPNRQTWHDKVAETYVVS